MTTTTTSPSAPLLRTVWATRKTKKAAANRAAALHEAGIDSAGAWDGSKMLKPLTYVPFTELNEAGEYEYFCDAGWGDEANAICHLEDAIDD